MSIACTIVARNYLAHARVLAESFRQHHPHVSFAVLIIDDEGRQADFSHEPFEALRLADVGFSRAEIGILAGIYDVMELATSVKPRLLQFMRDQGHEVAIYLDPDIKVFAPLTEALTLAVSHGIVLTPHTMVPIPRDDRRIAAAHILEAGIYNLGFIAVGPGSDTFLAWWWQQTSRDALSDPEHMMFTDQRSIDFVPSLFSHAILKDPGYNVAYWNLHGRDLQAVADGFRVDGGPLTFFHFSGFDHRCPHLLSKHQVDRPRILLGERPGVAHVCAGYLDDLTRHGVFARSALDYGWSAFGDGHVLTTRMRRIYRDGVLEAERDGRAVPPGPFSDVTARGFVDWLNEPVAKGPRPLVSRYLHRIYLDREDLRLAFQDLSGRGVADFLQWVVKDGATQEQIPAPLVPTADLVQLARHSPFLPPDALTRGVNIAGYFRAELGVGEAARLLTRAIDRAGIAHEAIVYDVTKSRQLHAHTERGTGQAAFDVNVVCVNADATPAFAADFGPEFFAGRHTVGLWFWEVEQFPAAMAGAFEVVDEVWGATRFVVDAIAERSPKPVRLMPLPVVTPAVDAAITRASLGLPGGFMFLFVFDFLSVLERKNPVGLVQAFTRAFRPGDGPCLVLKCINGERQLRDRDQLRQAIGDRPDIHLIEEYYSAAEKNALMGLCDGYVSLHRSEGFGLTMAEAMALGKPVIATGYSGNMDFMSADNSYLVDYQLVPVMAGCEPYPTSCRWAAPDLDHAAFLMRRVVEAPDEAAARGSRAREDVERTHGVAACARVLRQLLGSIRSAPRAGTLPDDVEIGPQRLDEVQQALDQARATLPPAQLHGSGARTLARRLLYRVLRPYWWPQRRIDELTFEAIEALQARERREAEARQTRVEGIEARLRTLERRK